MHITIIMSYFINNENQELLWNTISKIDGFNRIFYPGSPTSANMWFRSIIKLFYQEYPVIKKEELQGLNRKVLAYMVENLKSMGKPIVVDRSIGEPAHYSEKKEDTYQKQFMERQQQYDSILKKPTPPTPTFSENIKDEAISNMEELILNQKKLREEDAKLIAPPIDIKPSEGTEGTIKTPENNEINVMKSEIATLNNKFARLEEEFMKTTEIIQQLSANMLNTFTLKNT